MKTRLVLAALVLVACDKPPPAPDPTPPTPMPVASTAQPVVSATPPPAPTPAPAPEATASAAPSKDGGAAKAVALKPASTHVAGKNFALDVASPGCKVDNECAMTIKLVPGNEFHVNKEYPYKFVATAAPGVTYMGKTDATTFSKAAGDFAEQGEKQATMTVRFKPTAAGQAKVAGTYKLSICSAEQCQIEAQAVELSVPVM